MSGNVYSINLKSSSSFSSPPPSPPPLLFPPTGTYSAWCYRISRCFLFRSRLTSLYLSLPLSLPPTTNKRLQRRHRPVWSLRQTWGALWLAEARGAAEARTQGQRASCCSCGWGLEMEKAGRWTTNVKSFSGAHSTSVLHARCHHMLNTDKAQMMMSFKALLFDTCIWNLWHVGWLSDGMTGRFKRRQMLEPPHGKNT